MNDPPKILVVDDIASNLRLMDAILTPLGYKVISAHDGEEALAVVAAESPDLILIDAMMPKMDGFETTKILKANEGTKNIPVVMVTDLKQVNDKVKALEAGVDDLLTKPVDKTEVRTRVTSLLKVKAYNDHMRNYQKELETALEIRTASLLKKHEQLLLLNDEIEAKNQEIEAAYNKLKNSHAQLIQQEKMASLGQIATGIAHEINNPLGFIFSNLHSLSKYSERISGYLQSQIEIIGSMEQTEELKGLESKRKLIKLDYILQDMPQLISESIEGAERVKCIVMDLKTFARADEEEKKGADINKCIESTLHIIWNELKYKATVNKEFGELPTVKCNPGQISQIFMNLLVNAGHAIDTTGEITIKTWQQDDRVYISIADTGSGIPEDIRAKIFEPFFTTKEAGKGTGLGLSISYDIAKKHNGEIKVESEVGKGTCFTLALPVAGE